MSDQTPDNPQVLPVVQTAQGPQNLSPDSEAPSTSAAPVAPVAPAAPKPAAAQPQAQPGTDEAHAQHRSALGEIFQALAGGKKPIWRQTDQGPVKDYVDLKPGEMARSLVAAALTGLASGYDPRNRGKGPAAASAFSAGFRGEEEAKDKQQTQAANEAQEQFKNKNISDEKLLQMHRDAREQQESIQRVQEHDLSMTEMKQRIARGEADDKFVAQTRQQENVDRFQSLINGGATPVLMGGKPLEFSTPYEAMVYASDPKNHDAIFRPGSFDTVFPVDPVTGKIAIMQKPADYNKPRWWGVELDKDGNPVKDKDGKMTASKTDPIYDMQGRPFVPAGPMPRSEFDRTNEASLTTRARALEMNTKALEYQEIAYEHQEKLKTNKDYNLAKDHLNAANGDLTMTDKNGAFIVTPADRQVLSNAIEKRYMDNNSIVMKGVAEIQQMATEDPNRATIQAAVDSAKNVVTHLSNEQLLMDSPGDPADAIAGRLRQKYQDVTTGKVDTDAAKKDISTLPKAVQDKILSKLTVSAVTKSTQLPAGLEKAAGAIAHLPKDQQLQAIQSATLLSDEQKTILTNYFNSSAAAGKVRMVGPDGDIKDVDQKDVAATKAGGYNVVGKQEPQMVQAPGSNPADTGVR